MKTLVVYDSQYGNTEKLATAIASAAGGEAASVAAAPILPAGLEVLFVGSPTQGGRPTARLATFLAGLAPGSLEGVQVVAFDTRFAAASRALPLRLLMKVIGYAAPKIASALTRAGGQPLGKPEGFIVEEKEGPLRAGEIERAQAWAAGLLAAAQASRVAA